MLGTKIKAFSQKSLTLMNINFKHVLKHYKEPTMESNKNSARIAGLLIILGIVAGILSIVPAVEGEAYLQEVAAQQNQVLTGAVFQFLLVPIYIGFALLLYPLFKKRYPSFSIGLVGFRMISGAFQLVGMMMLPVFIYLSQQYEAEAGANIAFYETTGTMLRLFRDLTNHLGVMLATGLGNLCLYAIFLKGKYIPIWLSLWGVLGAVLIMLASFLLLFHVIEVVSIEYGFMSIPLVLQEIILAIWLMVKGLDFTSHNPAHH